MTAAQWESSVYQNALQFFLRHAGFQRQQGTKLGVLLDPSKEVPKKYTTEKYPETFLIDAQGRVRHYFINKRDWSKPGVIACLESLR